MLTSIKQSFKILFSQLSLRKFTMF